MIAGITFSEPRAESSRRASVALQAAGSRSVRTRRTPSTWARSASGSMRWIGEDLGGSQRKAGGLLGWQGERLIAGVRVQALSTAEDRGQRLDRRPHDVVVDRPGGQRGTGRLNVEAAHHRTNVRGAEAILHDLSPHSAGCAELGHLLEQLAPGREE